MQGKTLIWWASCLLVSTIGLVSQALANPVYLRDITAEKLQQEYKVTFHLSHSTRYRAFMLQNPARFIVDLRDVKNNKPLRLNLANQSAVKSFRYAAHAGDIFRVVFGLTGSQHPVVKTGGDSLSIVFHSTMPMAESHVTMYKKPVVEKLQKQQKTVAMKKNLSSTPASNTLAAQEEKTVITETDAENPNQARHNVVIVIDPGHGGKDPGATGIAGTHEKNVVLAISKILQKKINQQPGFSAVLTRTGDYYLTLRQRLAIARKDKADMFVAIHADMFRNHQARGVSVFALSQRGATSEAARWLAARENTSELMGGVDLQDKSHLLKSVLVNLSQSATIRSSLEIGNDVINSVKPIARLHHSIVEQAAFVVLKSPDIPSLLIETGFLSNQREEQRLTSPDYQNQLAVAIMRGIRRYFDVYPPRGTWLSYWKQHPNARRG